MENYDKLLEKAKLLKNSDCSKNDAIDELFPELKPVGDKDMMEVLENILLAADTVATREIYGVYGRTREDLIDWVKGLKKSNDQIYSQDGERIRNGLIGWLRICGERNQNLVGLGGISPKECISWLEFQPSKFIPKFKVGDVVTNGESTYTIDRISKDCYWVKEHDCVTIPFDYESMWRLSEQTQDEWVSDLKRANLVYQMAMNVDMVIEAKNLVKSGLEKANIWDLAVDTIKPMNHNNDAEKEKSDFVSGKFLYCRGSILDFKEGETYWLEYIGDDTYVGRSDNVLNQKFRITPRLLYTWFTDHIPCWTKDENADPQNKHENRKTEIITSKIESDEETDIQKTRREGRNDGIEMVINNPEEYGL